jgi:hypothetical protein
VVVGAYRPIASVGEMTPKVLAKDIKLPHGLSRGDFQLASEGCQSCGPLR